MSDLTGSLKTINALNDLLAAINTGLLDPQWGHSFEKTRNIIESGRPRFIAERIVQMISGQLSIQNSKVFINE